MKYKIWVNGYLKDKFKSFSLYKKKIFCKHLHLEPLYHSYKCIECGKILED